MVRLSSPIECIHKSSLAHTIFQLHTKSTFLAAMSKPEPFQETTYLALFPKYHADIKFSFYQFYHQRYVWQISIQLLSIEKGINETLLSVLCRFIRFI